ncbi:hypothetical protein BD410DRAFT_271288 [Rickenella mellea]|uniref:Uncharacterized protein n=1 Tax=Rickenella mellea TaxID=50990 RepID=A0A4Y7Q4I1_9AGAM|nr:hypothetical protein BD410DRAFT_271288 [Rickenella mellea]
MVIYSFGWTPMNGLYVAQALGYEARSKGFASKHYRASLNLYQYSLPVALEKINRKGMLKHDKRLRLANNRSLPDILVLGLFRVRHHLLLRG